MSWQSSEKKQKIINNHNKQGEMEAEQTYTKLAGLLGKNRHVQSKRGNFRECGGKGTSKS